MVAWNGGCMNAIRSRSVPPSKALSSLKIHSSKAGMPHRIDSQWYSWTHSANAAMFFFLSDDCILNGWVWSNNVHWIWNWWMVLGEVILEGRPRVGVKKIRNGAQNHYQLFVKKVKMVKKIFAEKPQYNKCKRKKTYRSDQASPAHQHYLLRRNEKLPHLTDCLNSTNPQKNGRYLRQLHQR